MELLTSQLEELLLQGEWLYTELYYTWELCVRIPEFCLFKNRHVMYKDGSLSAVK